jgi:hypothetical protein
MTDLIIGRALWNDLVRQIVFHARVYDGANFRFIGKTAGLGKLRPGGPANVLMRNSDELNAS